MRYKDYVKPGNKCIYVPSNHPFASDNEQFGCEYDELFGNALELVEISDYHPYFTNGLPDPTPEEYDSLCMVEVYSEQDGPIQVYFAQLLAVIKPDEDLTCIYKNESCQVIGYDPTKEYYVIEYMEDTIVRSSFQIQIERDIDDLTFDELKELRDQICVGSIYTFDYQNKFGVNPKVVCEFSDSYIEDLYQIFHEDAGSEFDTSEAFANFIYYGKSYPEYHGYYKIQVKENGVGEWKDFDGYEYEEIEIDDKIWHLNRQGSLHEFRKVYLRFENTATLKIKR